MKKEYVCSGDGCTVRPECRITSEVEPCLCILDGKLTKWNEIRKDVKRRTVRCEHAGTPDHRVCDGECELNHHYEGVGFTIAVYCPFTKEMRVDFLPVEGGRQ